MKLRIARSALADLEGIQTYYREQGAPAVGDDFVASILERFEMLVEHPDAGRKVPEFDVEHIRELIHPPFRLVYLRNDSSVNLVRVWRSERLLRLSESESAS